ncbi:TerB family tellurite resistance protein [Fulvivirga ligni]|uniref:tellurite resistance TerB family protein n=1 Tax=Fulvivirga ligni TaxID=2904246 RepID=UPI001F23BDA2|nr:TerB family tellurite resistance protein [Fulvivirga ligni]UII23611.1 TerB family tellurite resistance protein [Fulvivirga ligni]
METEINTINFTDMVKEQLNVLIQLAASDNQVADKEAKLIQMIGQSNGVTKEEIEEMLKNPERPIGNLSMLTPDQKFEHLYHIVQLMKIDGQVFKSEIVFCQDIAERLGYKKGVIAELSSRIFSDPSITADREMLKAKAQKYLK